MIIYRRPTLGGGFLTLGGGFLVLVGGGDFLRGGGRAGAFLGGLGGADGCSQHSAGYIPEHWPLMSRAEGKEDGSLRGGKQTGRNKGRPKNII